MTRQEIKKKEYYIALCIWLVVFAAYLCTLAPSVGFIDSGELASVAVSLGIAHPTGYPLFTMLARLFSMLPIPGDEILRLNIFSAFLTSLAATVFFFLVIELIDRGGKEQRNSVIIASLMSTLALAFSRTFWFQGLAIEVYSLHLLLVSTVLFLFVRALKTDTAQWWLLFSFTLGLTFTNHLTTVLLAPALLYWFFAEHGFRKDTFKRIAALAVPFLAGLSLYIYLPVRAAQHPLFNWGNPQTVEKLWWHVTGKQFRVFMFSSGDAAKKQLNYFISNLTNEFNVLLLAVAAAGFFVLLFSDRKKFFVILLLFVTCIAYSINYDIHDIDSYFLLAFISIGLFAAFAVEILLRNSANKYFKSAVIFFFIVLLGVHIRENFTMVDQRQNYLVEDYAKNILGNLPPNAIVISYQWDYFVAASFYYQYVKNFRTDIVVVDKELLRRSWYFPQLGKMHPEFIGRSKREITLFLNELYKFEHELPYDFTIIEGAYTALLKSFIDRNDSLALYVTPEIEPEYTSLYARIPEGFLFRLKKDTSYTAVPFPRIRYRDFPASDTYAQQIKLLSVNALLRREAYERQYGRDSTAELYHQIASEISLKYFPHVSNY